MIGNEIDLELAHHARQIIEPDLHHLLWAFILGRDVGGAASAGLQE